VVGVVVQVKHRSLRNSQAAALGVLLWVVGYISGMNDVLPGPSLLALVCGAFAIFLLMFIADMAGKGRDNLVGRWLGLKLLLFGPNRDRRVTIKRRGR
jgi:hypothetical protein